MPRLEPLTLRDAMMHASEMGQKEPWPRRYYWSAVWWRLYARESANPAQPLQHSRNQIALYRDCVKRPHHYTKRRSRELTDFQKMQEA